MIIKPEPLSYSIAGIPTYSVMEDQSETLPKEFDSNLVRAAIDGNFIKTESSAGCVGIAVGIKYVGWEYYLIPNFNGDGLTRVGVVDELADELKAQMHFIGTWKGFKVSDNDWDFAPRTDLEIDPSATYECYSRDGIVVFVKK